MKRQGCDRYFMPVELVSDQEFRDLLAALNSEASYDRQNAS